MSSNYPCLSIEDNVVKNNEAQKSNLANLLNMYCLDSDNIQKMAPKTWHPRISLAISFSLLICICLLRSLVVVMVPKALTSVTLMAHKTM